jgi:hypothetical protein
VILFGPRCLTGGEAEAGCAFGRSGRAALPKLQDAAFQSDAQESANVASIRLDCVLTSTHQAHPPA